MDFHRVARRDLQTMCKKNKIPENLTNETMADALRSLKSIEWDEDIKQRLIQHGSPLSPLEQHGSPLPRSRRVTTISGFSMGEINDKDEEMKKAVAEKVEEKKKETAVELKENIISDTAPKQEQEARTDVVLRCCDHAGKILVVRNDAFDQAPVRKFRTSKELYETTTQVHDAPVRKFRTLKDLYETTTQVVLLVIEDC